MDFFLVRRLHSISDILRPKGAEGVTDWLGWTNESLPSRMSLTSAHCHGSGMMAAAKRIFFTSVYQFVLMIFCDVLVGVSCL